MEMCKPSKVGGAIFASTIALPSTCTSSDGNGSSGNDTSASGDMPSLRSRHRQVYLTVCPGFNNPELSHQKTVRSVKSHG